MTGTTRAKAEKEKHVRHDSENSAMQNSQLGRPSLYADILTLQHASGNRAMRGLLRASPKANLGEGENLTSNIQKEMDEYFGFDFSQVRIHVGPNAEEKTRTEDASALTEGTNIYFGLNQYQPGSPTGKRILTHELAHVIQQQPGNNGRRIKSPNELEAEAELTTKISAHGRPTASPAPGSALPGVAQKATADEELRRKREQLMIKEFMEKGGGNVYPEGVSSDIYKQFQQRSDKSETFEQFAERDDIKKKINKNILEKNSTDRQRVYSTKEGRKTDRERALESIPFEDFEDPTPINIRSRKEQGREEKQGALRALAYDPDPDRIPNKVKLDLQRQLSEFEDLMKRGKYDENTHKLRLPKGYVLGHYEGGGEFIPYTPAREGFDLNNARVITREQNIAEENQRRANEKQKRAQNIQSSTPKRYEKKLPATAPVKQPRGIKPTKMVADVTRPSAASREKNLSSSEAGPTQKPAPTQKKRQDTALQKTSPITPDTASSKQKSKSQTSTASKLSASFRDVARGFKTSKYYGPQAKVLVEASPVPGTAQRQYQVTLTIKIGAQAGVTSEREGLRSGASLSADASGSLTASFTHVFSIEETEKYLGAVEGRETGAYQELKVLDLIAKGGLKEAKARLSQQGLSIFSVAGAKNLAEGDVVSLSAEGQVGASAGVSGTSKGGFGVGVDIGASRKGKLERNMTRRGGNIILTVTAIGEKGSKLGGSLGIAGAGFGQVRQESEDQKESVSFTLNPEDPAFQTHYTEIIGASNIDELRELVEKRPELVGSTTTGQGISKGSVTTPSIGPVEFAFSNRQEYHEEKTVGTQGEIRSYTGSASEGAALRAAGLTLGSFEQEDTFSGTKGGGETKSKITETDWLLTAKTLAEHPLGSVWTLGTGGSVRKERTDTRGAILTTESYRELAKLAEDKAKWEHAWKGNISTLLDWQDLRLEILDAQGNPDRIAKVLAEFESRGSRRSSTVETAISTTGIRFEFPHELADLKPIYDQLVAGNPFSFPRELAVSGKREEAVAELTAAYNKLGQLTRAIQGQQESFQRSVALAEMMRRIALQRTKLRDEIRLLSSVQSAIPTQPETKKPDLLTSKVATQHKQEEESQQSKDRLARFQDLIPACITLRDRERAIFAEVKSELESRRGELSVITKLRGVQASYEQWDMLVKELRSLYEERGANPDRANEFAPDRAQWQALYGKWKIL
jgi:hypothetical protein